MLAKGKHKIFARLHINYESLLEISPFPICRIFSFHPFCSQLLFPCTSLSAHFSCFAFEKQMRVLICDPKSRLGTHISTRRKKADSICKSTAEYYTLELVKQNRRAPFQQLEKRTKHLHCSSPRNHIIRVRASNCLI